MENCNIVEVWSLAQGFLKFMFNFKGHFKMTLIENFTL